MDIFKRLEKIRRCILSASFAAAVFLVFVFLPLVLIEDTAVSFLISGLVFLLFLVTLLLISFAVSSYKRLFAGYIPESVMQTVFEEVVYEPEKALLSSVIENTDLILIGNHYESSEYRAGKYRGVYFAMADVLLKNVIRHGKRLASITYFSGTWMIFDFEKAFRAPIQVKEKSFLNAQKPRMGNPNLDRVMISDESFSRFFKVYAENSDTATAFLSPELRDAILSLNYALRGDLMFYFNGNRLHIALHGKKAHYEPPIFGKLYREEVEKVLLADYRAVSAFLDRLLAIDTIFENGTAVTEG